MQQQYDGAQRAQAAGDMVRASQGYRTFLSGTLYRMATGQAKSGDYTGAAKLFDEALAVQSPNVGGSLRLAYAEAALVAHDITKAKALAQAVLTDDPKNSNARLVLGEALLQTDENDEARKQLEAAVALDASYKNGLALATAYLALSDTKSAAKVFSEMAISFGAKASAYLDFGRTYAEAGYPELAVADFEKAIAKNPALPEVHYCLGASYLLIEGEAGFSKAQREFHRELALHPNDYFSLSQLGYIALSQHRLPEAEIDLKRASSLDPRNPDNQMLLGQVYTQLNRPAEAEAALRQAIALTTDLSRNHYQVQRAHYLLGHLLLQTGRTADGKQEMQVSAELLKQNMIRDQARLKGAPVSEVAGISPLQHPADEWPADAKTKQEIAAFAARVTPALADSYNNLGAIAAGGNDFATATLYFEKAAKWNPNLGGLDYNWGRAAFAADFYAQATGPLERYLAAHPQDQGARRVLGISYFRLNNYAAVVKTLEPIEKELVSTPQMAYMYDQAMVSNGSYERGITDLRQLSRANPSVAEIHRALGEAYASHQEYQRAADELRAAVQLNGADEEAKEQLEQALASLEKKGAGVQP